MTRRPRTPGASAAVLAIAAVLLSGCATRAPVRTSATVQAALPASTPAPTATGSAVGTEEPEPVRGRAPERRPARTGPAEPVELAVPAIGVHAGPLIRLGLDARGALEAPPDAATLGWFTLGPPPGAVGPAVIAGHVAYSGTPGVFHRLGELVPGDEITVTRADGTPARFAAYLVEQYPNSAFPTERVYGDTAEPELRLVTSRGDVVVYARLVRVP